MENDEIIQQEKTLAKTGAERHPEKQNRPDSPIQRKPDWIRVRAPTSPE
jgi:lipoic acid synthetase